MRHIELGIDGNCGDSSPYGNECGIMNNVSNITIITICPYIYVYYKGREFCYNSKSWVLCLLKSIIRRKR